MSMKQFVKAKPLCEQKQKPYQREIKKNSKTYKQKVDQQSKDAREHIKIILNNYKTVQKNSTIIQLIKKYPKIFVNKSLPPQPQVSKNFVDFLWYGSKKQNATKKTKQLSEDSQDPNWDSDEDKEVQLVSKKIDQSLHQKIKNLTSKQPSKKLDELQKYEKQFLQDYYRSKRHQTLNGAANCKKETEKIDCIKEQKCDLPKNTQEKQKQQLKPSKQDQQNSQQKQKPSQQPQNSIMIKKQDDEDCWGQYNPHVSPLIAGGFIQKVQKCQQQDDFQIVSYQSDKSNKSSSGDDDDGMLTDDGPSKIIKTKADKHNDDQKKQLNKAIVLINNHLFTQIAQQLGLNPQTCDWIFSNKTKRYKASTQYMNQHYKNGGVEELSTVFPYISLNNYEFVHCDQIQTQKGIEKLRRSIENQKLRKNNNLNKNNNNNNSNKNRKNSNSNAGRTHTHYKQKK